MKRFLFLGLIATIAISMSFPLVTNSERPDKTILWTRFLGEESGFGAPIADSESVYVASPTKILCYGIDSGELLWEREFPKSSMDFHSKIFVSLHDKFALYGNADGLTCLDIKTGETVWEKNEPLTSNVEIVGDTAYAAFKKTVCKIDVRTGSILLEKEFEGKDNYSFVTIAGLNKLFIATVRGLKKMVNIATGKVLWENNSLIHTILDKPIISGKCVVVSGYNLHMEYLMFFDIETGKILKNLYHHNNQMDVSDGRVLTSNFCYSTETLKPLWEAGGNSRFFDCFDSVFFWSYDVFTILDWNGNKTYAKGGKDRYVSGSQFFKDRVWLKPAASNGKYALVTQLGYLVCYQNKPDMISYLPGDEAIGADGKKVFLNTKPYTNDNGELMVEPRGFLEPLGWVSSHVDGWWEDKTADFMCFHDYNRIIVITASEDPGLMQYLKADKIIKCQKTPDGRFIMPLEQMVSEFGLSMTKDGDRIKLSYQSK